MTSTRRSHTSRVEEKQCGLLWSIGQTRNLLYRNLTRPRRPWLRSLKVVVRREFLLDGGPGAGLRDLQGRSKLETGDDLVTE